MLSFDKVIGIGSYGDVYNGKYRNYNVAIKCIKNVLSKNGESLFSHNRDPPLSTASFTPTVTYPTPYHL